MVTSSGISLRPGNDLATAGYVSLRRLTRPITDS